MLKLFIQRGLAIAAALAVPCSSFAEARAFPPLPEPVTSFGAVTADGWLYVFGGHKGTRHEYSAEMVSGAFHRLRLADGEKWESLPAAFPGQGQPLVAHAGKVYRVGGMAARNRAGDKQDLYSVALVQRYDTGVGSWQDIAPLPATRSSHDAAVLGDKLYVAGGWELAGGTNLPVWPDTAFVLDLRNPGSGWQSFPQPFQRRALALAAVGGRVYCIGGMNSSNAPSLAVDVYDVARGEWSKGPDLPSGRLKGFGCSAIAQDGRVYVTAFKGDLLRLSADGASWEIVGRLEHPRVAHRLVTAGQTQLIALGGEDGEEEKLRDLELLVPSAGPLRASNPAESGQAASTTR